MESDPPPFGGGRRRVPDRASEGRAIETPRARDELGGICYELLVNGGGRREIEVDERERLEEEEAREIASREAAVRSRKRQLRQLDEDDEESDSEREEERRRELREMEREIEALGDEIRAPDPGSAERHVLESFGSARSFEVIEPSTDPSRSAMWEPTFVERARANEEQRAGFVAIYPGRLDQRHAAVKALIAAAGPRPSLGMRSHVDLARSSMVLLTREVEDDLLRTPKTGERGCRQDALCQIYAYHGHVARECLSPDDALEFERSGVLPLERRRCLGCMRYDVTWFWMYLRWRGEHVGSAFISGHYNLTNMRGEYLQDQTLLSSTHGLPLHVVPFVPGALVPRDDVVGGERVVRFVQKGMVELDEESDFP